ncbi:MAG TPA: M23 family metallopeptidase [Thermoanaerobaculia bacterium]|nr:M23 family metallopeptidase [Thermoanaerobaculia bacterium]
MSIPDIEVTVYPAGPSTTQRQLLYLELAPADTALAPVCPLPLQLWIKNKQSTSLHLEKIEADFSNPTFNKALPVSVDLGPGAATAWYASNDQYIILPSPPPSPFTLKLYFTSYDTWTDSVFFIPFPTPFQFPGKAADLAKDEFWSGKGAAHAGGGDQIFHYDLGMIGWNPDKNDWTFEYPGKDGTHNQDYHIWNRPVYALADGVVTFYQNSVNENPVPGTISPEGYAKGYGNAFNIQHGPYLATYMHMRKGSLNPALITGYPEDVQFSNGATVKAGDFLGLAGNAGTSSAPHLHVGLVVRDPGKGQFSVPLPFSNALVVQDSELIAGDAADAPWVDTSTQGLPWIPDPNVKGAVALAPFLKVRNPNVYQAAIDPVALVLGAHSQIYVLLTLPDPPPIDVITEQIRAQVKVMGSRELEDAQVRLKGLQEYVDVLGKELGQRG